MRILCLIALAALSGCASQPETASMSETPAPAAAPVAAPAPAAAASAEAAAEASDSDEYKPPVGYKRKVENGQVIYCTKVTVLGSRFPKDDCRTQQQLRDMELQNAINRTNVEQSRRVCSSAAGCGNP